MCHTAPQHFSSPIGTLFKEFFSPFTIPSGLEIHVLLVRRSCLPSLVQDDFVEEFQISLNLESNP